jgi:hypothetical protein
MEADPLARCRVCGEKRPPTAVAACDPFCSAGCCPEAYRLAPASGEAVPIEFQAYLRRLDDDAD